MMIMFLSYLISHSPSSLLGKHAWYREFGVGLCIYPYFHEILSIRTFEVSNVPGLFLGTIPREGCKRTLVHAVYAACEKNAGRP
jgi:hypothetical protein